ncbi:mannonate dehydratase [Sulfolobus sp. A20]|uniref:mannonate dehydratase n=1 Tax=Sulfolobaceae TaxID=118883 RepID=UPI000845CC53|nr:MULTISPECIES: mannonate dehydratase [unclassified Sulfolobus]TRM73762.1 mannonate dehydratase [Sulfolobus sp. E5]TRM74574.1 mannonate dehydratase [Sulfolobus sp. A20-N-F8]TRM80168.1 mannonate dehydratase [Sulfolobus sp. D5]TRM85817.1 mannonate dehydratase [Sulfolobus sp. E3]TRM86536.1 mannonate dehydratase [Sulfolobus sp. C3]TRM98192.1 mannonate dehydratase [Sulfolobus sp. E1]TRM98838.1 mannonate dehydratase [Sulfolobus sp. F1]
MQKLPRIRLAEILLESSPTPFWQILKQIGVEEATGILPRWYQDQRQWRIDEPWDYASLANYKRMVEDAGFKLTVIEDNPPMDKLIYGLPGKEEQKEYVFKLIENMGKLKIPIWCYNWMPTNWLRTRTALKGRGDAVVSGFDEEDLKNTPPPKYGKIDKPTLWRNLESFLKEILPVAEDANVKLAIHPDDPPIDEVRGTARIMNSVEAFERLITEFPSEYNGITFDHSIFSLIADDEVAVVSRFLEKGRVFFVHFREVIGNKRKFVEVFIDEGLTRQFMEIREYVKHGFYGPFRVDHTPTLLGDTTQLSMPGYSILGRIHAIGYLQGLFRAAIESLGTNYEYK